MEEIQTLIPNIKLVEPSPMRDAQFAYGWFKSDQGKETLLLMGNIKEEIKKPTLKAEEDRVRDFLKLKEQQKQFTWMIRDKEITIGAVWLEFEDTKYLKAPAIHIMIGDKAARGKGIGTAAMQGIINYVKTKLKYKTLYSRHLASNTNVQKMNTKLGFVDDGLVYKDKVGLSWQNIKLELRN